MVVKERKKKKATMGKKEKAKKKKTSCRKSFFLQLFSLSLSPLLTCRRLLGNPARDHARIVHAHARGLRARVGGLTVGAIARGIVAVRAAHRSHHRQVLLLVLLLVLVRLLVIFLRCTSRRTIRIVRLGRRKGRSRDGRRRVALRGSAVGRRWRNGPRQRSAEPFRASGGLPACRSGATRAIHSRLGEYRRRKAAGDRGGVLARSHRQRRRSDSPEPLVFFVGSPIFLLERRARRSLLRRAAAGCRLCSDVEGASHKDGRGFAHWEKRREKKSRTNPLPKKSEGSSFFFFFFFFFTLPLSFSLSLFWKVGTFFP